MTRKILVVDDDDDVRKALRSILAVQWDVLEAADGPAALRKIHAEHPRLLLLDVDMPGMGGLSVLKAAREIDPGIAVVMLTGQNDIEIAMRALNSGARAYITKPFDAKPLRAEIARLLEESPTYTDAPASKPWRVVDRQGQGGGPMGASRSNDKPLIVWVEDNRDYQAVVKEWLLSRYDVVTFENGEEFLDEIQQLEPDLVMLDVRLPGPDGFKLCRKIRAEERLQEVPILFLTSCEDDETYIKHLDVGGTGFVTKPIDKKKLLAAIGELVDGQRSPQTI